MLSEWKINIQNIFTVTLVFFRENEPECQLSIMFLEKEQKVNYILVTKDAGEKPT